MLFLSGLKCCKRQQKQPDFVGNFGQLPLPFFPYIESRVHSQIWGHPLTFTKSQQTKPKHPQKCHRSGYFLKIQNKKKKIHTKSPGDSPKGHQQPRNSMVPKRSTNMYFFSRSSPTNKSHVFSSEVENPDSLWWFCFKQQGLLFYMFPWKHHQKDGWMQPSFKPFKLVVKKTANHFEESFPTNKKNVSTFQPPKKETELKPSRELSSATKTKTWSLQKGRFNGICTPWKSLNWEFELRIWMNLDPTPPKFNSEFTPEK